MVSLFLPSLLYLEAWKSESYFFFQRGRKSRIEKWKIFFHVETLEPVSFVAVDVLVLRKTNFLIRIRLHH